MINYREFYKPGQIVGDLTVVRFLDKDERPYQKVGHFLELLCKCGQKYITTGPNLKKKQSKNCTACKRPQARVHDTALNTLFRQYKTDAVRRSRPQDWTLSIDDFKVLVQSRCHYCGAEPNRVVKTRISSAKVNGVDRVNNDRGYHLDNSVSCCKRCNRAKDVMTKDEFLSWVAGIQRHQDLELADRLISGC